jgi:pimeloyl-ACP methyl ester carboxylesterase
MSRSGRVLCCGVPHIAADDASMQPPAPDWFTDALADAYEPRSTTVDGVRVDYRCWGPAADTGIVLLHGSGAHAGWWDHIGPQLARSARVVAISLSGHGNSGRRPRYSNEVWADEVAAVIAAEGLIHPTLVAHSMSGQVAATLAARPDAHETPGLNGVVFVDWVARDLPPERVRIQRDRAYRVYRRRADLATAIRTFRPSPRQPSALPYVLAHIARSSYREVADGWELAFDSLIYDREPLLLAGAQPLNCRSVLLRAEHGTVLPADLAAYAARAGAQFSWVELPAAHHHVMIDQPLVLVTGLRTQLNAWAVADGTVNVGSL